MSTSCTSCLAFISIACTVDLFQTLSFLWNVANGLGLHRVLSENLRLEAERMQREEEASRMWEVCNLRRVSPTRVDRAPVSSRASPSVAACVPILWRAFRPRIDSEPHVLVKHLVPSPQNHPGALSGGSLHWRLVLAIDIASLVMRLLAWRGSTSLVWQLTAVG